MRRTFAAIILFTAATSLLALAEKPEKPVQVAVLKTSPPNQSSEAPQPNLKPPKKSSSSAKKYLPMPHFGGY